jgi:hypothetical protein
MPELHKIPARLQCTVRVCRRDWRTCTPHHTVAGRSSISLTQSPFPFPSATAAAHPLSATCRAVPLHPYALASRQIICLSHMPSRAVASFARMQAELHTSSHTVRCARLVHLWYMPFHHNKILVWKTCSTCRLNHPNAILWICYGAAS